MKVSWWSGSGQAAEWAGPGRAETFRPGPESPDPGRTAFLVVITWESEEKLKFLLECFTFYVRSLNHETIRAKSFTGSRRHFVTNAYVFTFLADDSSVNRSGGHKSC